VVADALDSTVLVLGWACLTNALADLEVASRALRGLWNSGDFRFLTGFEL
jgi:hypothetical protein